MNDSTDGGPPRGFESSRIHKPPPETLEPGKPRLGRRESEPHSANISHVHDVLQTNFPSDRATWDLHHYFTFGNDEIDLQFDVSWFKGLRIDGTMSSYRAIEHGNRVPDLAINVLSKRTWHDDIGENADACRPIGIPVYVVFAPYHVASQMYKPPFLRVYLLVEGATHRVHELRRVTLREGGARAPLC
ncbi:MAG: hypothetical protein Q6370_019775 [Candidatus Sigynarchaeota archaeon]